MSTHITNHYHPYISCVSITKLFYLKYDINILIYIPRGDVGVLPLSSDIMAPTEDPTGSSHPSISYRSGVSAEIYLEGKCMNIVLILYTPIEMQMGHKSSDSTKSDHWMETLSLIG